MKKLIYLFLALLIVACSSEDGGNDGDNNGDNNDNQSTDTTAPIITILGESDVSIVQYTSYTDAGATATDNVDGNLTSSIVTSGSVNINSIGSYTITYNVSDEAGNTATASRQVIVTAAENPVFLAENGITIKAREWAVVGATGEIDFVTYTVVDEEMLRYMVAFPNEYDITKVATTRVTDMSGMFYYEFSEYNQPIGNWDVSNVTNMSEMFRGNLVFNQPIGDWDVSNVTNMFYMFHAAEGFNQPIGDWDVSNVTDMRYIFGNAYSFNQPIGNWDVSNVTSMSGMFSIPNQNAQSDFNQDISNWDVSNVNEMMIMFRRATSFNKNLSSWDVSNVTNCDSFSEFAINWTEPKPNFTICNP